MIRPYPTRYGIVFHSSVCKDDFKNVETITQFEKQSGDVKRIDRPVAITLQRAALKSLKQAEVRAGEQIVVTGSIRSCELQAELYRSDSSRYAAPNSTLHTQGLAIDVNMNHLTGRIRAALLKCGWHQARPTDEPWHFSFKLTA